MLGVQMGSGYSAEARAARGRVVGLDMLRGLTMAVMLLVDYAGDCYPSIGHADWDGVHLADFVMPCFLWVCGASMSISLRVRPGEAKGPLLKVLLRSAKLFLLGLALQGSFFAVAAGLPVLHVDLARIRIMGILQRIALSFLLLGVVEVLCPRRMTGERLLGGGASSGLAVFKERLVSWVVTLLIVAVGTGLTYGVQPPAGWPGCAAEVYDCAGAERCEEEAPALKAMACSAVGYLDSSVFGVEHVYIKGSAVYGGLPSWGFDPEGLATSLSSVLSTAFGLHCGYILQAMSRRRALLHWLFLGLLLAVFGAVMSLWVPFNKRLWSPSYSLLTTGAATLACTGLVVLADTESGRVRSAARAALAPLQWLGGNCILFFVLSDCSGLLDWLLRAVTWGRGQNIVIWFQDDVLLRWFKGCMRGYERCGPAVLTFVCVELLFWVLVCGALHRRGIFWKL